MTMPKSERSFATWVVSLIAVGFGLLSLKEGGTILFGAESARAAAGNYVPFVLWFNFAAGFAYIAAGIGLLMMQRWAMWLAVAIAAATVVTFAAFGAHIAAGGTFEYRTVVAMSLRTLVWMTIALIARFQLVRRPA